MKVVHRKTSDVVVKPTKVDNISIHNSLKFPLVIAKIFGYFPVNGLLSNDYKDLRFSWCSLSTLHTLATCSSILIVCFACVNKLVTVDSALSSINGCMFSICGLLSCLLFLRLAREWPGLIENWHFMETKLGNKEITTNLRRKVKIITLGFLLVGAVEHILIQLRDVLFVIKCTHTLSDAFKRYFVYTIFPHLFAIFDYAIWKGIFFEITNIQMTFSWTFVDVFIMVISTCFTMRVTQIVAKIENALKNNIKSPMLWKQLREEHALLRNLCFKLDNNLGLIVILCFWTNLYYTLIQLYSNLHKNYNDDLKKSYFTLSFIFLLGRTVGVCLYGAAINDASQEILPALLSTPTEIYNVEIKRFIEQVEQTTLAISGRNFFKLTKGLILNLAGAIVTYELVLIQFKVEPDGPVQNMNITWWIC